MPEIIKPQEISGNRPQPKKRTALFAFLTAVLVIVLALLFLCIFPGGHEVLGVVLPVPKGKPVVTNLSPLVFQQISPPSGGGSSLVFFPTGGTGVNVDPCPPPPAVPPPSCLPPPPVAPPSVELTGAIQTSFLGQNYGISANIVSIAIAISNSITVANNSVVVLTWNTVNNPTSCQASGDWSGSKNVSGGSESTGPLSGPNTYVYTLTCYNPAGSGTGNFTVNVSPPGGGGVDVCPNLPGIQSVVPVLYDLVNGNCIPVSGGGGGTDACSNLSGIQSEVPVGYNLVSGVCVPTPSTQCVDYSQSCSEADLPLFITNTPSLSSAPLSGCIPDPKNPPTATIQSGQAYTFDSGGCPHKSAFPSCQITPNSDQKVTVEAEIGALLGGTCNDIKAKVTIIDNGKPVAGPFELDSNGDWSGDVEVDVKKDEPHNFEAKVETSCEEGPTGFGPSAGESTVKTASANIYKFKMKTKAPEALACPAPAISACQAQCPTITLGPASLPNAPSGQPPIPYLATLTASGGSAPYTFAVTSGTLPSGLILSGDKIMGTPNIPGIYNFTITATDANGCTSGSQTYTILVD